jgi:hypothetical protein
MRMQTKWIILVVFTCSTLLAACDSDETDERLILQLLADPSAIPADGTSIITARVFDSNGVPVPNVGLNWENTLGALEVTAGDTDANGRKTATLRGTGVSGTAIITVTVLSTGDQANTPIRIGLD